MKLWCWRLLPLIATALIFVVVSQRYAGHRPTPAPGHVPVEAYDPDHCTWWCHNHGCRHRSRLPAFLSGDQGLYGATIRALHAGARMVAPRRPDLGYGALNLLVFCVLWPAGMYVLWWKAVGQRRQDG